MTELPLLKRRRKLNVFWATSDFEDEVSLPDIEEEGEEVSDAETVEIIPPSEADTVEIVDREESDSETVTPINPPPFYTPQAPKRVARPRRLEFADDRQLPAFIKVNGVDVSTRDTPDSPLPSSPLPEVVEVVDDSARDSPLPGSPLPEVVEVVDDSDDEDLVVVVDSD